jgi:hypothetical protein
MARRKDLINQLVETGLISVADASTLQATPATPLVGALVSGQGAAVADASGVASQGTLTIDTIPADTNTMTVDAKVYTFEDTLTDVDGNIFTGGTVAQAKLNIVAAFDLSGTAGVDYAASMTAHPTVDIAAFVGDDAVLTAKDVGTAGDSIDTTETFTPAGNVFDGVTLGTTTAGVDPTLVDLHDQLNALLAELRSVGVIAT